MASWLVGCIVTHDGSEAAVSKCCLVFSCDKSKAWVVKAPSTICKQNIVCGWDKTKGWDKIIGNYIADTKTGARR